MRASDGVSNLIAAAVKAIIAGEPVTARRALEQMDYRGLIREREQAIVQVAHWVKSAAPVAPVAQPGRDDVPDSISKAQFQADNFTCRYSHCAKRLVYSPVLAALSRAFPDLLGSDPEFWSDEEEHIVFWTCTASIEHVISFPYGGGSAKENLITSCSQCNYAKKHYPLVGSLWRVSESPANIGWSGLIEMLPELRQAVGIRKIGRMPGRGVSGLPKQGSLIRFSGHRCPYRVEDVRDDKVELRMMWRSVGRWNVEKKTRWLDISTGSWEELLPEAPQPGDPV